MRRWMVAAAVSAGCTGDDTFTVPEYQDGLLVQGMCPEEVDGTDQEGLLTLMKAVDPLIHLDGFEDEPGRIIRDQGSLDSMLAQMNFASTWLVDWEQDQVAALWYHQPHACALTIEETHTRTASDGTVIVDGTFYDEGLNCGLTTCTNDLAAVQLWLVDAHVPAAVCRRVRPGCPP